MELIESHASVRPQRPRLPARLHPTVQRLLREHSSAVAQLVSGLGSPLHILLPQVFEETARQFVETVDRAGVEAVVLFAKKANKARCFAQYCASAELGVDVASAPELEQALAAGVRGEQIGVSGPSKAPELIELGIRQGCWLAVDSCAELMQVAERARSQGRRARVLLRCRAELMGQIHSRFGLSAAERNDAIGLCLEHHKDLLLQGVSFHLTGYSVAQRASMTDHMADLCVATRAAGLADCRIVNMGGGFAVRYVEPSAWEQFAQEHAADDFHANKTFPGFYPYASPSAGAAMLAEILASKVNDGSTSLSSKLIQHRIRLLLEPGRALLDQGGVTAFRIQGVKDRHESEGYAILTAEGTSFSLSEQWFNSEYLPDPILLGASADLPTQSFTACVGGSTCLESDMITWRKIAFDRPVRVGDIVVYANTAGYQMDSNESPFHGLPLPRKVVVTLTEDNAMHWRLDEVAAWDRSYR